VQRDANEGLQREAAAAPPGDGPLRVEGLARADEEHAEVDPGRDQLPANAIGVVLLAEVLDLVVEVVLGEQPSDTWVIAETTPPWTEVSSQANHGELLCRRK